MVLGWRPSGARASFDQVSQGSTAFHPGLTSDAPPALGIVNGQRFVVSSSAILGRLWFPENLTRIFNYTLQDWALGFIRLSFIHCGLVV